MTALINYLRARYTERSTWIALTQGVGGAAAAQWPYNLWLLLGALVASMIPTSPAPPAK